MKSKLKMLNVHDILGFADLEEKFNDVFEKFETLERDDDTIIVTAETSLDDVPEAAISSEHIEYF